MTKKHLLQEKCFS